MGNLGGGKPVVQLAQQSAVVGADSFRHARQAQGQRRRETRGRVELRRRFISRRKRGEPGRVNRAIARGDTGRQQRAFATLRLAADLDDDARTLGQIRRRTGAQRQKPGPLGADIYQRRIEPGDQTHHSAEMDAAGRRRITALDMELDGDAAFEPGGAPLAGPGADQELVAQRGRYKRPARSCAVSNNGRPTTFEYDPASHGIKAAAQPWIA